MTVQKIKEMNAFSSSFKSNLPGVQSESFPNQTDYEGR